jgi:hypothetical protein
MAKMAKRKQTAPGNHRATILVVVILFAAIGTYLTWRILAATGGAQASFEAESSSLSGSASVGNDANASGGQYVQFGP